MILENQDTRNLLNDVTCSIISRLHDEFVHLACGFQRCLFQIEIFRKPYLSKWDQNQFHKFSTTITRVFFHFYYHYSRVNRPTYSQRTNTISWTVFVQYYLFLFTVLMKYFISGCKVIQSDSCCFSAHQVSPLNVLAIIINFKEV